MAPTTLADKQLFWYVVIHLVFVFSSVLLALSDRIAGSHDTPSSGHGNGDKSTQSKAQGPDTKSR